MPTFKYEAVSGGDGGTGVIEATDRAAAVRQLTAQGLLPRKVEAVRAGSAASAAAHFRRASMSKTELAALVRELATGVNAGLPIVAALRTVARQGRKPAQKVMLERIITDVERGKSMAEAMRGIGRPFSELLINLVHAGEIAGRLGEVLTQAAVLLERDVKLRRSMASALVYPAMLAAVVVIAVVIVVTVIVPQVLSAVAGVVTEATLPLPTRIVLGVADFTRGWWWLVLLAIAGGMFLWARMRRTPGPRLAIDRALIKTPVLGNVLRDVAVARFTRTFGTLAGAGLPVLTALRVTRGTLGNAALEQVIDDTCDAVSHGKTLADPLEDSGMFPPMFVQIVAMGERSGKLDEMLMDAAAAFEDKTEQTIKLFNQVLPPLLIMAMAPIVVLIIAAVILPLIELQQSLGT
ncbi:MAG: type II secretion system F family protein [Phycisphaerales bacterium]|nr:type II secretion system F family protein [Phycisphaerales bacterium]